MASICGDFLSSVDVDPEATSLAAEAATQTAAPQPTLAPGVTDTVPASAILSPSPLPTVSPVPLMTVTAVPRPTKIVKATAIAEVLASPVPTANATPASQAAAAQPWVPLAIGVLAVSVLVISGWAYLWRRRSS